MKPPASNISAPEMRLDHFDVSPVSMWLEDYSELKRIFDGWRAQGVSDLRAFLNEDPNRVAQCSSSIRLLKVNARTLQLLGAESFEELQSELKSVLRDEMHNAHVDELVQLWSGSNRFQSQTVNYSLDGRRLDVILKGLVLPGHEATWDRVLVVIEDITELETARRQIIASEMYARNLFEHAPVSLWVLDFSTIHTLLSDLRELGITNFRTFTDVHPEFVQRCLREIRVLDVNRHTLDLYKARDKQTLIKQVEDVFQEDMLDEFREKLIGLWEGDLVQQREIITHTLDGDKVYNHMQFWVVPGHENKWDLALTALTDITARKKAENYLEYLGQHDVLTGLKNRAFFTDEVERLRRKGLYPLTAVVLDLNNLKSVNDELGHAAGDALLRRCGEVISKAIDKPMQASRTGGDEFIILMPDADEARGELLIENIEKLVVLNNQFYKKVPMSLSIGMATCRSADGLDDMLRRADLAMYEKKREYHRLQGTLA
jgi:diguanylate cyclase (GGDEF) domain